MRAAEAKARCSLAGPWQSDCAEAWAGDRERCSLPISDLLEVCPTDACRFAVVDNCPRQDVIQQVDACESHAGRYAMDCVGHAMQTWLIAGPKPSEVGALMARPGRQASVIGAWAGLGLARLGEGTCEAPAEGSEPAPENVQWCLRSTTRCETEPDWCSAHWLERHN